MNQPSDTPPDGDFARYVERLTSRTPVTQFDDMRQPNPPSQAATFPATTMPAEKPARAPFAGLAFAKHVRWLVAAVLASQVLARFAPNAALLIIPLLAGYAGWLIFRINQNLDGALAQRFRALADRVNEKFPQPK